jgi:hypothetical protein
MRRALPLIALSVALAACSRAPVRLVTPAASPPPAVTANAAGVTLSAAQVSVGATVQNADARAAHQIGLDLRFLDARGRTVASTTDSLPWCPAGATCLWGGTFVGSQFGAKWNAIDRVEITVRVGYWTERAADPLGFEARREDGTVVGTIPGREGDAYIVGFAGGVPVSGIALVIRSDDRPSKQLADEALLPAVTGERLVGAFYPGEVPAGH